MNLHRLYNIVINSIHIYIFELLHRTANKFRMYYFIINRVYHHTWWYYYKNPRNTLVFTTDKNKRHSVYSLPFLLIFKHSDLIEWNQLQLFIILSENARRPHIYNETCSFWRPTTGKWYKGRNSCCQDNGHECRGRQ